jgi:hypothetical protein
VLRRRGRRSGSARGLAVGHPARPGARAIAADVAVATVGMVAALLPGLAFRSLRPFLSFLSFGAFGSFRSLDTHRPVGPFGALCPFHRARRARCIAARPHRRRNRAGDGLRRRGRRRSVGHRAQGCTGLHRSRDGRRRR